MAESIDSVLSKVTEALDKHGEAAVTTVLETASLMALYDLISAAVFLILSVVLLLVINKKQLIHNDDDFFLPIAKTMGNVFCGLIIIITLSTIINPIIWKGVSEPKYYITYKLINKIK
jgi:hypothetical protein